MDAKSFTIALLALVLCCGCALTAQKDSSVVYSQSSRSSGAQAIAFDQGSIPEGDWEKLVVPEGTKIVRTDEALRYRCVMKKEASSAANTPDLFSTDRLREKMGCAIRREGRATLHVGTFGGGRGENGSGARSTKLTLYLPRSLKVEFVENLSGIEPKGIISAAVNMNAVPSEWTALLATPAPEEAAYHRLEEVGAKKE